jgi:hypothetical protein
MMFKNKKLTKKRLQAKISLIKSIIFFIHIDIFFF